MGDEVKKNMILNQKIQGIGIILLIVGLAGIPSSGSPSTRLSGETPQTHTLHITEDVGTLSGYVTDTGLNPV
jgi:hypothetical protein